MGNVVTFLLRIRTFLMHREERESLNYFASTLERKMQKSFTL